MFHLVFVHPEIPPNTGNAMRLSANTGCTLHLIEPLGFDLSDAKLRRAGMDYRDKATVVVHADLESWRRTANLGRVFAFAKKGNLRFTDVEYRAGDTLMFGCESVGLSDEVLAMPWLTAVVHIPMRPGLRSLNLSNSAAVAVFEGWRQLGFEGSEQR